MDAPTPLWDNLLETQLGKRSKCSVCDKIAVLTNSDTLFCNDCAKEDGMSASLSGTTIGK